MNQYSKGKFPLVTLNDPKIQLTMTYNVITKFYHDEFVEYLISYNKICQTRQAPVDWCTQS